MPRCVLCGGVLCPVNCVVSAWSTWDLCDKECGSGQRRRERKVIAPSAHGGDEGECLYLIETEICNTLPCPVNCVVSDWSAWGACSASCGSASKTRVRSVITSAANNGTCVPLADTTVCTKAADNVGQCPYACLVSEFGDWGGCSKRNCGGGLRYRIRTITHAASASSDNLGHVGSCPEATNGRLLDYETCNDLACSSSEQARDCDMSEWGTWGLCRTQGEISGTRQIACSPTPAGSISSSDEGEWQFWSECSHATASSSRQKLQNSKS